MIVYVNGLLSAWGRWANRGRDGGVGWAGCSAMFKDAPAGKGYGSKPPIGVGTSANDCEATDAAVRRLSSDDCQLCIEFYQHGGAGVEIAARIGVAKRTLYDRLHVVHARVLGHLQDIEIGC